MKTKRGGEMSGAGREDHRGGEMAAGGGRVNDDDLLWPNNELHLLDPASVNEDEVVEISCTPAAPGAEGIADEDGDEDDDYDDSGPSSSRRPRLEPAPPPPSPPPPNKKKPSQHHVSKRPKKAAKTTTSRALGKASASGAQKVSRRRSS